MKNPYSLYNVIRGHYESVHKLETILKAYEDLEETSKRLGYQVKLKRKPWRRRKRKKKIHK